MDPSYKTPRAAEGGVIHGSASSSRVELDIHRYSIAGQSLPWSALNQTIALLPGTSQMALESPLRAPGSRTEAM